MTDPQPTDGEDVDLYSSFEEFNTAMGAGVRDPHEMLADIRAGSPVLVGGFADMMSVLGGGLAEGEVDMGALLGEDVIGAVALNYDQLEAVRSDRTLVPQAIEEALRWEPPLTAIMRTATRDVALAGTALPSGSVVIAHLGAANRDPSRWDEPDRFDLLRDAQPHASFALGPHTCLGMHLARMETRVALEALLDHLPDLRLDPDSDDPHITGLGFRSPTSIPVLFAPR